MAVSSSAIGSESKERRFPPCIGLEYRSLELPGTSPRVRVTVKGGFHTASLGFQLNQGWIKKTVSALPPLQFWVIVATTP